MRYPTKCKRVVLAMALVFTAPTALAFSDGSGWEIVLQMQESIKTAMKTLKSVKEGVKLYSDIRQISADREKSWDVVNNPIFKEYVGDMGELADMDDFKNGLEAVQTVDELDKMLDAYNDEYNRLSGEDKKRFEHKRNYLVTYRNLRMLEKTNESNYKKSMRNNSERASGNITANATAGMFDLAIEDANEREQERMARGNGTLLKKRLSHDMGSSYRHLGEPKPKR